MEEKIIHNDFEYIRSQLLEVEKYLASDNDGMEPALIMLDDIIRHVEAYIKEDL